MKVGMMSCDMIWVIIDCLRGICLGFIYICGSVVEGVDEVNKIVEEGYGFSDNEGNGVDIYSRVFWCFINMCLGIIEL